MFLAVAPVTTRAARVWVYVDLKLQVARCQTLNLIVRKGIMTRFLSRQALLLHSWLRNDISLQ